jgi:dATP pyrophosphohydrolase
MDKIIQKIQAVIFRRTPSLEFLLLQRTNERGGYWQSVTGSVEDGESIVDALTREIKEETGIVAADILTSSEIFSFIFVNRARDTANEHVFMVEVKADVKVNISNNVYTEHKKFAWIGFKDASRMVKFEANRRAVDKVGKKFGVISRK